VLTESQKGLAFVCVYIKRAVLDAVGPMDARFDGYGSDDIDYCRRVRAAGFRLMVTPAAVVEHGFGELTASSSFLRQMSEADRVRSMGQMRMRLEAKWSGCA
jgi:GT2 family glycosyltransferase